MYRTAIARNAIVKLLIGPQSSQFSVGAVRLQSGSGFGRQEGPGGVCGRDMQEKQQQSYDKEFFEKYSEKIGDDIQLQIYQAENLRDPNPMEAHKKETLNDIKGQEDHAKGPEGPRTKFGDLSSYAKNKEKDTADTMRSVLQEDQIKLNKDKAEKEGPQEGYGEFGHQSEDINFGQRARDYKKTG